VIVGIDIGGTRIKTAAVSRDGEILTAREVATPSSLEEMREVLRIAITGLQSNGLPVEAVGLGCKGIIHPENTEVVTLPGTLHYLEGHRLSSLVAEHLPPGCPVFADNDARAALAGESVWGAARGCKDALLLTLGTGIGGAILSDGRILRGTSGVAGHIGHLTVDPEGVDCICGNRGCLETIFSARAIESAASAAVHRGVASELTTIEAPLTCEKVFACARHGDAVAQRIVSRASMVLGAMIGGLIHVLDPEVVILSGQIAESLDILLEPLRSEAAWRSRSLLRRTVPIVKSELPHPSGVLGAAALAMR
jgi:glucokinase